MHTVCHRLSETHCNKNVAQYVRVLVNHVREKVSCGPCFRAPLLIVNGVLSIGMRRPLEGHPFTCKRFMCLLSQPAESMRIWQCGWSSVPEKRTMYVF